MTSKTLNDRITAPLDIAPGRKVATPVTRTDTDNLTPTQAAALDWLNAKEIEDAAKAAEPIRKAAGNLLNDILGKDGLVTVNKGGFTTYRLEVQSKSRVSEGKVIADLIARHPHLAPEIAALKEQHTNPFKVIGLKRTKR